MICNYFIQDLFFRFSSGRRPNQHVPRRRECWRGRSLDAPSLIRATLTVRRIGNVISHILVFGLAGKNPVAPLVLSPAKRPGGIMQMQFASLTLVAILLSISPAGAQSSESSTGNKWKAALFAGTSSSTKVPQSTHFNPPATWIADQPSCTAGVTTCEDYGCSSAGKRCVPHYDNSSALTSCSCE
jgi:hypothetical protein